MNDFLRKWGLALNVLGVSCLVLLIKIVFQIFNFEIINNNPLLSSVIGGMTFLIGFILAGTMTDYKESEKLPVEILSSLENIYEEGMYLKKQNKRFDMERLNVILNSIVDELTSDIVSKKQKKALHAVSNISEVVYGGEKLGLPTVWLARIKADQSALKKNIFRIYSIKDTQFIPAAYAIVEILVIITISLLIFLKFDRDYEGLLMTTIVSYIFIYMTMLIKDIDDPFGKSYADINMDMMQSFKKRN